MSLLDISRDDLIAYRLNQADETLIEAKLMAENNKWNTRVNRLYYACFYAVTALLVKHNLKHNSHDGVKNQFGLHFEKPIWYLLNKVNFIVNYSKREVTLIMKILFTLPEKK